MEPSPWILQAEHNLEVARYLKEKNYWSWSTFLSHQAAEVATKGVLLLFKKSDQPDHKLVYSEVSHRINELLEEFPFLLKKTLPLEIRELEAISKDFTETRYPKTFESYPPFTTYTLENAEKAYTLSEKIVSYCKKVADMLETSFETLAKG